MSKLIYDDKTNINPVTSRENQATAEDFNEIKASVNALYDTDTTSDTTTEGRVPVKVGTEFKNSAMIETDDLVRFDKKIEVPPGTIRYGEGSEQSAIGVIPLFRSLLTGNEYTPPLAIVDANGTQKTLEYNFAAETTETPQPIFTTSTPLTGSFTRTIAQTERANELITKTNAGATLAGFRVQIVAQSTGEPIYYYPSKIDWENDVGDDLVADGSGNVTIDLNDAPLGFLAAEVITFNYKIDSGVLLGTGTLPYQEFKVQIATLINMATEPWVVQYVADHGGGGATTFTGLTDTPGDKNVPGIQNVVVNPFDQEIQFKEAELADNKDIQISAPASGEILKYDEGIAKWLNDEPRFAAALQSFNDVDYVDGWQDQGLSILFANDNNIINTDTPENSREGDVLAVLNMNTEFGKTVILNALVGQTINSGSSYTVHDERVAFFVKTGTDWEFGGENTLVTTLTGKSVTDLTDVSDAGGGVIPSTAQLAKVDKTIATFIDSGATEFDVRPKFKAGPGIQLEETENTTDTVTISNTQTLIVEDGSTSVGGVEKITVAGGASVVDKGNGEAEIDVTGGAGQGITVRNDMGEVANNITDLQFINCDLSSTPPQAQFTPLFRITNPGKPTVDVKELALLPPLEVSVTGANTAQAGIQPGYFELHQAPSFYATLQDDVEVVGVTKSGVRTGVIWCDNVVKDGGTYISIDRDNKAIGLQEDDNQDPNITGGTPYIVHVRHFLRGDAPASGYMQAYLRDKTTKQIVTDWKGNPVGARKAYSQNDEMGAIDFTFIKKYTGLEYFQNTTDDSLGEEVLLGDRTNGNTCIMIQAIDTTKQTSTGILQLENDVGYNILWTAHFLGEDVFTLRFYLEEDRPEDTVPAGSGETGADGWHFYNWNQMKAGVSGKEIQLKNDSVNLVGYSFGKVLSNEKTEILKGSTISVSATARTPKESLYVYKAKWTGAPDQYTKEIVTGIVNDVPIVQPGWTLLPDPIFFIEDISGNANTETGAYTVDQDAKNIAFLFIPGAEQSPYDVSITDFSGSVSPSVDGFYIKAKKEPGEKYLEFSDEYFECGLTSTVVIDGKKIPYGSLRYTINSADTPMPAGSKIKGNAPIVANWNAIGGAVDYLEFTDTVTANIGGTTYRVLPGESIPDGGDSDLEFFWSEETSPGVWAKIPESVKPYTVSKGDAPTDVTTKPFEFKAKAGSRLRPFANADRDDGAYIDSDSDHIFLCLTTIAVKAVVPGSEDEPVTSIYVQDELFNDWELTAGTDGHLRTLLVGDLPENIDHHVLRSNFSGNDFVVDTGGIITLVDKPTTTEYTEISANVDLDGPRNYIVDTLTPAAAVTINIPYEEISAFTVRDETKEFDAYNCIITIRDALDAIVHTATLNKRDKGWIFYNSDGTEDGWRYGEIGKGLIVDIASDHVASTDFGDVYTDTPTWDCRRFNSGACYDDPNLMMMGDPGSFASKQYVDGLISNPPRLDAYLSTDLSVTLETETVIAFDTVEKALGITLSGGEATFTDGGRYTGHIVLRANEDRDPVTYIWLERKPAATGVWELFNNMLSMIIKEDVTLPLPGDIEVLAGDKVRIKIYFTKSDASLDLESTSLVVGLGTIVQPSASISIVKVGEVTP